MVTGIAGTTISGFALDPGPGDVAGLRFAHASGATVTNANSVFPVPVFGPNSVTKASSDWTGPYGETVVTGPFDRLGRFLTFGWYGIEGYARTRNAWLFRGESRLQPDVVMSIVIKGWASTSTRPSIPRRTATTHTRPQDGCIEVDAAHRNEGQKTGPREAHHDWSIFNADPRRGGCGFT